MPERIAHFGGRRRSTCRLVHWSARTWGGERREELALGEWNLLWTNLMCSRYTRGQPVKLKEPHGPGAGLRSDSIGDFYQRQLLKTPPPCLSDSLEYPNVEFDLTKYRNL